MRIEFEDGKYATGFDEHGRLFFELHGEPWPGMSDAMAHSPFMRLMVAEIGRLRDLEHEVKMALWRNNPERRISPSPPRGEA